ncbi:DNA-directed RNA polymerase specialized sigma subunit, sigma24 family [Rathayibacter oskolensis]|uniref:DNA-directed RNA polymerase specialized sigma subunit, sigma24 family n=1 Tax=Rathayibacter oskolensis TaxID=1891671 RepID=A0A1X7P1R8_9MICO|nr:sigma-70 family RNA polymerase sigma factor [Rathayibacter oskolensis]SMH44608.1 DNA-directed RNA polymerase specialized sigma subunit, sigma24 family [Rathayibacter oskolensis]
MPAPLAGPDRFAAVAAAVADPVRRYLWRRTDEVMADDVLIATLAVLRRRSAEVPAESPAAWAIGVARLELQNARRTQRRQVLLAHRVAVVDPPQVRVDSEEGPSESDETVRLVLARLREADAELLRLWAWEALDSRAIAEVLVLAPDAAASRLERARRRFAELFATLSGPGAGRAGMSDDEIRWRMRSTDPARGLAPLTAGELGVRLAAATGGAAAPSGVAPRSDPRSDPSPDRRRSRWMIAGVGALSLAAAATLLLPLAFGLGGGAATRLALPATGGPASSCAPVTAEALVPAELAFSAEVTSIDGGVVTLRVLDRFAGEVGDSLEVTQADESAVDGAPIAFEPGVDYLIAATGGTVLTCGLSGPASAELGDVYREAFALR